MKIRGVNVKKDGSGWPSDICLSARYQPRSCGTLRVLSTVWTIEGPLDWESKLEVVAVEGSVGSFYHSKLLEFLRCHGKDTNYIKDTSKIPPFRREDPKNKFFNSLI